MFHDQSFWLHKKKIKKKQFLCEAPGISPQITGSTWPVMCALAAWLDRWFHGSTTIGPSGILNLPDE